MSSIGPELPPHLLAKRKRQQVEDVGERPAAIPATEQSSTSESDKRRKVMGPAMPPAPIDQMPHTSVTPPPDQESEDSDDDFGPALPSNGADLLSSKSQNGSAGKSVHANLSEENGIGPISGETFRSTTEQKMQRDEWMTMPPQQDDLAARMDPTKQRPKAFNTGKGAKGPNSIDQDSSMWHETPEQKRKRLQDEIMGVTKSTGPGRPESSKDASTKRKDRKVNVEALQEQPRGPSLLEQHKMVKGAEAEDDPSKRTFDREKDMAAGGRISSSQRTEMLNKASGFSTKFSGGTYL